MSNLEVAVLVGVAIWLVILTLIIVLVVRQVGLLLVHLSLAPMTNITSPASTIALDEDGPAIGSQVPEEIMNRIPTDKGSPTTIMLISAICIPCHELVKALRDHTINTPLVALVTGHAPLADDLAALLPPHAHVIHDPDAVDIANRLDIHSTPFGFVVYSREVVHKSYLRNVDNLLTLTTYKHTTPLELIEKECAHVSWYSAPYHWR